jgi:two-component system OmpR family sensor kinase
LWNKQSIFFTLSLFFVIAIVLLGGSFVVVYKANQMRQNDEIRQQHKRIVSYAARAMHEKRGTGKSIEVELKEFGYEIISKPALLLDDPKSIILDRFGFRHIKVLALKNEGSFYIYIQTPHENIMLKDTNEHHDISLKLLLIFLFVFVLFMAMYIVTLQKLYPLKTLQQKIKELADENYDLQLHSDKKDEISLLANEFDTTAKKLNKLKEARNIFIRNIMHELKTPITKGRLLIELPQSESNKQKIQRVFLRLESLINEFAAIEQLLSHAHPLNIKNYHLQDIIDNAIDISFIDESQIEQNQESFNIKVDYKLFSIVVKNLLDNAIKYSFNNKVILTSKPNRLIFQNRGKALQQDFLTYCEPFIKEQDSHQEGFGLGLYITKHILDAHHCKLAYRYVEDMHTIEIIF